MARHRSRRRSQDVGVFVVHDMLTKAMGIGFFTELTVVRPFSVDDAPSDPEVMRFSVGEPDPDLAATVQRLERYACIQAEHGFSKWAVWERVSGAYLGDAGLTVLPETGEVELGYRLARAHWGRGLATEVARSWLHRALRASKFGRIIAFADRRNPASIRIMEKIGMTFDREDHLAGMDCVVYEANPGRLRIPSRLPMP